jgi:IS4 transposase
MFANEVLERFATFSPASVMVRATMENILAPASLDEVFESTAERQRCRELLFSSVVDLLGLVTVGTRKSVNDAYAAEREQFTVSIAAVYQKLQKVEIQVSRQMVRQTAVSLAEVVGHLGRHRPRRLPGYKVRIIDGNHLPATEHRIAELRKTRQGPLPGHCLAVLDPDLMLVGDVFPCEDGHAQERSVLPQVLETVQPREVWIGDRNFCTTKFLFGIAQRKGFFVIRQHGSTLTYELEGQRRNMGRCPTGMLYEQAIRISNPDGESLLVRRVTVKLDKPTRDGETEIHVLTNLPYEHADARTVADLYLCRWTVENAFQELGQALHSEIKTLAYPKAALLSFCVALLAYNVISVVKSAMAAVPAGLEREQVSGYYLAGEIAAAYHGMMIAVPPRVWRREFAQLTPLELAEVLKHLAAKIRPDRFRKNVRGPKKPRPKRISGAQNHHISTARILAKRKQTKLHAVKA